MSDPRKPELATAEQWQDLFRGICFELRSVLSAVEGFAELVQEQIGTSHPAARNMAELRKAASRATKIVRDVSPLLYKPPPGAP